MRRIEIPAYDITGRGIKVKKHSEYDRFCNFINCAIRSFLPENDEPTYSDEMRKYHFEVTPDMEFVVTLIQAKEGNEYMLDIYTDLLDDLPEDAYEYDKTHVEKEEYTNVYHCLDKESSKELKHLEKAYKWLSLFRALYRESGKFVPPIAIV